MNQLIIPFISIFFLLHQLIISQTTLQPGDLAIIALGANVGGDANDCDTGSGNSGRDFVSFVCFKDIGMGTTIDLTDNGWERENAGLWGNTEGFLRVTRTGPTIPAGTVITFEFPPSGVNYLATAPDNQWRFESLGTSVINFNSNGDQLFFLQGGNWNNGTIQGTFNGLHDAQYENGRVLFAFNSKIEWNRLADDSKDSGLPPEVDPCFFMAPTSGTTNFIKFIGNPFPSGSQIEWIGRIRNPNNWESYNSCEDFNQANTFARNFSIDPSGITMNCSVCNGCSTIMDTLTIRVPEAGGPFDVFYTDGIDTFQLNNVTNDQTIPVEIQATQTFKVTQVTAQDGCPIYSNLGEPVTIRIGQNAPEINFTEVSQVSCFGAQDGRIDFSISSGQSPFTIRWTTSNGTPIDSLNDQTTATGLDIGEYTIEVLDGNGCMIATSQTITEPSELDLSCNVFQDVDSGNDGIGEITIAGGLPPYAISWIGATTGNSTQTTPGSSQITGLAAGIYDITVTDANNCVAMCTLVLQDENCKLQLSCTVVSDAATVGGQEGSAEITPDGGTSPYTLTWEGPQSGTLTENSDVAIIIGNLGAGDYNITIEDNDGCLETCAFNITEPNCSLESDFNIADDDCNGSNLYSVNLSSSGANGNVFYDWNLNSLDGLAQLMDLVPGEYEVIAIDEANCRDTVIFSLSEQTPINATITSIPPDCDANLGRIIIEEISGGLAPYTYAVNQSTFNTIHGFPFAINELSSGNYDLTIGDAAGCERTYSVEIGGPASLTLELLDLIEIRAGDSVLISGITNFTPVVVQWSPALGLSHPDSLISWVFPRENTVYNLEATDETGCTISKTLTVNVDQTRNIFIPNIFSPNGDGANDTFTIYGSDVEMVTSLRIFDRWGNLLFQSSDFQPGALNKGWDGKVNGEIVPAGTYLYMVELNLRGQISEVASGAVTLMR